MPGMRPIDSSKPQALPDLQVPKIIEGEKQQDWNFDPMDRVHNSYRSRHGTVGIYRIKRIRWWRYTLSKLYIGKGNHGTVRHSIG